MKRNIVNLQAPVHHPVLRERELSPFFLKISVEHFEKCLKKEYIFVSFTEVKLTYDRCFEFVI